MINQKGIKDKKLQVLGAKTGVGNRFKLQIIERRPGHPNEGKVVNESDWQPNLILGAGMDSFASNALCSLFQYAVVGTGTTATASSSGSITLTTSGTTVTSNTAFFTSGMVGQLLVVDAVSGLSVITAYTSSTQVTTAAALNVTTAATFTVYAINQTGLTAEVKRTNTYLTGSANCFSSLSGSTYTHQRTYDFSIEISNTNYNEIGFSSAGTSGNNLFSRAILAGAPVSVLSGQQLRVIYQVLLTISPTSPVNKTASISGWPSLAYSVVASSSTNLFTLVGYGFPINTVVSFQGTTAPGGITFGTNYYLIPNDANTFYVSATMSGSPITLTSSGSGVNMFTNTMGQECFIEVNVSTVNSDGTTNANSTVNWSEPYGSRAVGLSTDTAVFPTFPSGPSPSTFYALTLTKNSYSSGAYALTEQATIATENGNSSAIRKIGIGTSVLEYGPVFFFNTPQQKTNLYTLTLVYLWTWTWVGL